MQDETNHPLSVGITDAVSGIEAIRGKQIAETTAINTAWDKAPY